MSGDAPITSVLETAVSRDWSGRGQLLVVVNGLATNHLLPECGEALLGRSPTCDVTIDHPSVSRQHARLNVSQSISIEDLGSVNGTCVRDVRLEANCTIEVALGEVVHLGQATVVIERRRRHASHQIWSHDYFETRVGQECARATRTGEPLAVVRVHSRSPAMMARVQLALAQTMPARNLLGVCAPGELELLLLDTDPAGCRGHIDALRRQLGTDAVEVRFGVACFPIDSTRPADLLRTANAALLADRMPTAAVAQPATAPPLATRLVVDPAMRQLYRLVDRIAVGRITVLVLGETGVGKEVLARAIHGKSPRADAPFVALNCSALPETLLESELFGHEKGAFTGAFEAKPGLLESAHGGTVFLDEVGEMRPSTQAKLLRVIEQREVLRVGGLKPRSIDVRFVAATNKDLDNAVRQGQFRADLLYRLNGISLRIPALRDRTCEIVPLCRAFARDLTAELGVPTPEFSSDAFAALEAHAWPGNIREVRNVVERAVLLSNGPITPSDLSLDDNAATDASADSSPATAEAVEKQRVLDALAACGGNQSRAAQRLGVSRRTLIRRLTKFGIARPIRDRSA